MYASSQHWGANAAWLVGNMPPVTNQILATILIHNTQSTLAGIKKKGLSYERLKSHLTSSLQLASQHHTHSEGPASRSGKNYQTVEGPGDTVIWWRPHGRAGWGQGQPKCQDHHRPQNYHQLQLCIHTQTRAILLTTTTVSECGYMGVYGRFLTCDVKTRGEQQSHEQ